MRSIVKPLLIASIVVSGVTLIGILGGGEALAQARAALVRDIDNSDRQLVTMHFEATLNPGTPQNACGVTHTLYDVPAGKRLVIDFVHVNALMDSDTQTPGFQLFPTQTVAYFPTLVGKTFGGLFNLYTADSQVTLHRDGPGTLHGCAFRNSTVGFATIRADVVGHLVDLQ
jgi:hypothetical protein